MYEACKKYVYIYYHVVRGVKVDEILSDSTITSNAYTPAVINIRKTSYLGSFLKLEKFENLIQVNSSSLFKMIYY